MVAAISWLGQCPVEKREALRREAGAAEGRANLTTPDRGIAPGLAGASPDVPATGGGGVVGVQGDTCRWCASCLEERRAIYCSRKCRQAAWRLRGRRGTGNDGSRRPASPTPGVFAYADPPYPGTAKKWYGDQPTYAGEVDHAELVASLGAGGYAGWALSTSSRALSDVLPLCPPGARVCAWVKPIGVSGDTYGLHSTWEALIVVGGRKRRPGIRDWLRAMPARGWGTLPGRKPIAFCAWLFDCLGMEPGDTLVDMFPGTGAVSRAWVELSSRSVGVADGCSERRMVLASLVDERPEDG